MIVSLNVIIDRVFILRFQISTAPCARSCYVVSVHSHAATYAYSNHYAWLRCRRCILRGSDTDDSFRWGIIDHSSPISKVGYAIAFSSFRIEIAIAAAQRHRGKILPACTDKTQVL